MQGLTIAVTGDFGESRGHDKMKQWILHNGGRFASEISPRVTHLICSKEHYKKSVSMGMVEMAVSSVLSMMPMKANKPYRRSISGC